METWRRGRGSSPGRGDRQCKGPEVEKTGTFHQPSREHVGRDTAPCGDAPRERSQRCISRVPTVNQALSQQRGQNWTPVLGPELDSVPALELLVIWWREKTE